MNVMANPLVSADEGSGAANLERRWAVFVATALVLLAASLAAGAWFGRRDAVIRAHAQLGGLAALSVSTLTSELAKQRVLCGVLAQDPEIRAVLASPDPARVAAIDGKLEALRDATGAGVIYLISADGHAIAASNYREPDSFIGVDYRFRDYYRRAVRDGTSEQFALGSMSHRPGAYLARSVGGIGVLVVKVAFEDIEREWLHTRNRVLVTNPDGIVLLASEPRWQFATLGLLGPAARDAIRASRQFGVDAALRPLPLRGDPGGIVRWDGRRFAVATTIVRTTPWMLHLLVPIGAALDEGIQSGLSIAGGAWLLLVASAASALHRANRSAAASLFNRRLQHEVRARTGELHAANASLRDQMAERQSAEARLAALQSDLVQANRLAMLGQIAASVGHEINQPVAAIRTYADNAATLLETGQSDAALRNLARIAGLTETVGVITGELRGFSRKARGGIGPMPLDEPVAGARMLTAHRLRLVGVTLEDRVSGRDLRVRAERIRVEQILVNLIGNAADAAGGNGCIVLSADTGGGRVRLSVADNGPGIPPERLANLFMPFSTDKPNGLGLGLVVSRDLARDMGGTLGGENPPGGGALFTLELDAA